MFNLYAGSYMEYLETDMGLDLGYAILAKASMSGAVYRPGFDIALSLFHETHPEKGPRSGRMATNK